MESLHSQHFIEREQNWIQKIVFAFLVLLWFIDKWVLSFCMAPMWVLSLHHAWFLSLLHLEDHFCFGNWTPCSWETTQNWQQGAKDKQLPHNSGLPPWVSGPTEMRFLKFSNITSQYKVLWSQSSSSHSSGVKSTATSWNVTDPWKLIISATLAWRSVKVELPAFHRLAPSSGCKP